MGRLDFQRRFHVASLRTLYAYWQELRGSRRAPARSEIDPARLVTVMPNIAIFDVEGGRAGAEGPRRYRIRLMGLRNVSWFGVDPTGSCLDELDLGNGRRDLLGTLDQVVERGLPGHMTGEYSKSDGRSLRYERLLLPLSSDGQRIDMLIAAVYRLPPEAPIIGHALDLPEER